MIAGALLLALGVAGLAVVWRVAPRRPTTPYPRIPRVRVLAAGRGVRRLP